MSITGSHEVRYQEDREAVSLIQMYPLQKFMPRDPIIPYPGSTLRKEQGLKKLY